MRAERTAVRFENTLFYFILEIFVEVLYNFGVDSLLSFSMQIGLEKGDFIMAREKNVKCERVAVRVPVPLKEWYTGVADSYGMSVSSYMCMVLTNHMNQKQNEEAVRELTRLGGSELNEQSVKALSELVQILKDD